jgi:phosphohistidine phosphatase SixA
MNRRTTIFLLALLLCVLATCTDALALQRIYLCRHMEKGEWPGGGELAVLQPLSQEGARHALRMARHLQSAGIAAVYTSQTVRTWGTGLMVARQTGADLIADDITISKPHMAEFLERLKQDHADDEAVLIVGHSNTLPELLVAWGAQPDCYQALGIEVHADEDMLLIDGYDHLFVIDVSRPGCAGITVETVE